MIVLLCCCAILALHASGPIPSTDKDSWVLLTAIKQYPLSKWFVGDWPLENGFYRPVTVVSFYLDTMLGSSFGWSAAIYCALCVLALFWFVREITDSPAYAAGSAVLFSMWHTPIEIHFDWIAWCVAACVFAAATIRDPKRFLSHILAAASVAFLATELIGIHRPASFYHGVMLWLPSRTATVMTLFSLVAMASYARFVRTTSPTLSQSAKPIDPPATRTSSAIVTGKGSAMWMIASACAVILALGSYEQAIVLPCILLFVALIFVSRRYKVQFGWHAAYWLALILFLFLRNSVLPNTGSVYLAQQSRLGLPALLAILDYVLPCSAYAVGWFSAWSVGVALLLVGTAWSFPFQLIGNLVTYVSGFKNNTILLLWLSSVVAFLPAAFLKPFSHYQYWPMALRSIFAVMLVSVVTQLEVSAISPRVVQAPRRPSPAPGSLHHP